MTWPFVWEENGRQGWGEDFQGGKQKERFEYFWFCVTCRHCVYAQHCAQGLQGSERWTLVWWSVASMTHRPIWMESLTRRFARCKRRSNVLTLFCPIKATAEPNIGIASRPQWLRSCDSICSRQRNNWRQSATMHSAMLLTGLFAVGSRWSLLPGPRVDPV